LEPRFYPLLRGLALAIPVDPDGKNHPVVQRIPSFVKISENITINVGNLDSPLRVWHPGDTVHFDPEIVFPACDLTIVEIPKCRRRTFLGGSGQCEQQ